MIITRTPFRITLGGGGTDLPTYYSKHRGFIFAAGIDKYMFININRPIVDNLVRVKYTKSEIVNHRDEVQHNIAREAMRMVGIEDSLEIISIADIPAGTGLGSSSCYAVGLLHALHTMKKEYVLQQDLAEEACHLEIDSLGKPIGKQDQYMASLGGLTVLEISKNGKVRTRAAKVSAETANNLSRNLLLFYTGKQRDANQILFKQSKGAKEGKKQVIESMHNIKEIGYKILEAVEGDNISEVGVLFDKHWQYKKRISPDMSNSHFDEIYDVAKNNGALGGKITGAGGGGFFVFYVERNYKKFREAMKKLGLKEMLYRFDYDGTKVLVNL